MTKLGIIGAMSIEVESLKESIRGLTGSVHAGMTFYEGKLEGLDVVVVVCGVGKVNAALCVQVLRDCYQVTHIVNTGVAGSLCAQLDIGDFVVSKDAMYHDFNCSPLNYKPGQVPGMSVLAFPADETLINYAYTAAQNVHKDHVRIGRVASGDQFVCEKNQKQRIIDLTGALCTEMEGTAIAQAAWRNEVPFVIIRAISDKADDSAQMDYPVFEAIAAKRCADVTRQLARQLNEYK